MDTQVRRRLVRFFNVYDADDDGVITQSDPETSLQNLAALRDLKPGTAEFDSFREGFLIYWHDLREACDADADQEISLDEWLAYHEKLIQDEDHAMQTILPSVFAMFDVMDVDGSGSISMKEYGNFMRAFGVPDDVITDEVFAKLDENGNGSISKQELGNVVRKMYFDPGTDHAGNYLFGTL